MTDTLNEIDVNGISLRMPKKEDGMAVYQLIEACPPLDLNASYCYLLQCAHFSKTSVVATKDGEVVGFISGYLEPDQPDTILIWQVAVGEAARGCGLATSMLKYILSNQPGSVKYLETTITKSNKASWALFEGLANKLSTDCGSSVFFDEELHFKGQHESEHLVRIGPFNLESQQLI